LWSDQTEPTCGDVTKWISLSCVFEALLLLVFCFLVYPRESGRVLLLVLWWIFLSLPLGSKLKCSCCNLCGHQEGGVVLRVGGGLAGGVHIVVETVSVSQQRSQRALSFNGANCVGLQDKLTGRSFTGVQIIPAAASSSEVLLDPPALLTISEPELLSSAQI
ncbi:hypothetical protein XENOCAPTIV_010233, partial [Xenoophorus captivus]